MLLELSCVNYLCVMSVSQRKIQSAVFFHSEVSTLSCSLAEEAEESQQALEKAMVMLREVYGKASNAM